MVLTDIFYHSTLDCYYLRIRAIYTLLRSFETLLFLLLLTFCVVFLFVTVVRGFLDSSVISGVFARLAG